jgi:hypothetical protein
MTLKFDEKKNTQFPEKNLILSGLCFSSKKKQHIFSKKTLHFIYFFCILSGISEIFCAFAVFSKIKLSVEDFIDSDQ